MTKNLRTCNEAIPGEETGCSCSDCEDACEILDFEENSGPDFVIVEGVDGMTFIMVVIFVVGTIIFLAIICGHSVLKNSVLQSKCLLYFYFGIADNQNYVLGDSINNHDYFFGDV